MQKVYWHYVNSNALSFTEAEKRIMEEMSSYISGAFEVSDIKKARYKEVVFDDADSSDKWYKVKVQYITARRKNGKREVIQCLLSCQCQYV